MTNHIAVLIPCFNEEASIATVVNDFHTALPGADIYVYDNNSTDRTSEIASAEGAIVRQEKLQGKGNVVRRMFADVDADIYIMVDGDDTYDASVAPKLVSHLVQNQLDMVNARRVTSVREAYRTGHRLSNKMITGLVARLFGKQFNDMLSGYRVFSRRYVKSFPALTTGFEIETELTVHALELRMPVDELDTAYKDRPDGSTSKLRTYSDGMRILLMIMRLVKEERPLAFFFSTGLILALLSLVLIWPIILTYIETGLVPRFPTAILSTGLMLLAFLSFSAGLILDTVTHGRRELKRLQYLQIKAITPDTADN
jgi:glycosyltransferase involved in cell wall biosynthesis